MSCPYPSPGQHLKTPSTGRRDESTGKDARAPRPPRRRPSPASRRAWRPLCRGGWAFGGRREFRVAARSRTRRVDSQPRLAPRRGSVGEGGIFRACPVRQALGPACFCSLGFLVSLSIKTRDCLPIRMITRFLGFQTNLREAVLNTGVKHRSEYRYETSRGEGWGWGESGYRAPSPTAAKRLSTGCSQRVLLLRTSLGPKFSGEIFSP